jgi:hypothetical protein
MRTVGGVFPDGDITYQAQVPDIGTSTFNITTPGVWNPSTGLLTPVEFGVFRMEVQYQFMYDLFSNIQMRIILNQGLPTEVTLASFSFRTPGGQDRLLSGFFTFPLSATFTCGLGDTIKAVILKDEGDSIDCIPDQFTTVQITRFV